MYITPFCLLLVNLHVQFACSMFNNFLHFVNSAAVMVEASKPQQSAMLGEVAVPGAVWSDIRCLKIATRQRDVTLERLQTARRRG